MTKEELISGLKDIFGEDGEYIGHRPIAIIKPSNLQQLKKLLILMKRQNSYGLKPKGFGTTYRAYSGDVIVDLTNFNEIVEIDESRYTTTVQSGVDFDRFSEELNKKNLKLPLSPVGYGTIGGFIAYNGFRIGSYKYGSIRNYLRGATLLTSKKLVKLGTKNTPPFTSGYNFTDILVGSMGFFGVIIDVTLGLIPIPELHYDFSLIYETIDDPNIEKGMKILNLLKNLNSLSNLTIRVRTRAGSEESGEKYKIQYLISLEGPTEIVQRDNEKLYSLKNISIKSVDNSYISDLLKEISVKLILTKPILIHNYFFEENWYEVKDLHFIAHFLSPNEHIFAILGHSAYQSSERVYECSKEDYFSKENLPLIKKMKSLLDPHNLFQLGMLD